MWADIRSHLVSVNQLKCFFQHVVQNAAGKQHTMLELTPQEIEDTKENRVEIKDPVACSSNKVKLLMIEHCPFV